MSADMVLQGTDHGGVGSSGMPRQQTSRLSHRLTILTYNIHSCRGADGVVNPARIAKVIESCSPDIVALQEVDVGRRRSGGIDQARAIANHLRMDSHFHPALHLSDEKYGDAVLTRLPSRLVKAGMLPSIGEPRGAVWVCVDVEGTEFHVINTHLGLRRRERMMQVAALLGPGWLSHPEILGRPAVLVGDFNCVPSSAPYRAITRFWPATSSTALTRPKPTFSSRFPILRLDHIFTGPHVAQISTMVESGATARAASDHLPLVMRVEVTSASELG